MLLHSKVYHRKPFISQTLTSTEILVVIVIPWVRESIPPHTVSGGWIPHISMSGYQLNKSQSKDDKFQHFYKYIKYAPELIGIMKLKWRHRSVFLPTVLESTRFTIIYIDSGLSWSSSNTDVTYLLITNPLCLHPTHPWMFKIC